jgi:cell pole-organizing protein PopZ
MPEMSQEKTQDKGVPEPSMEEILSSIRRIIADEDKEPDKGGTAPEAAATQGDVLELTKGVEEDAMDDSLVVAEPEPGTPAATSPAGASKPGTEPARAETSLDDASLVSAKAAAASMSAFAKLAKPTAPETPSAASGLSVEALVVQLLKPLLREWLDRNLPPLVERIVEQEVRKLARRAELS